MGSQRALRGLQVDMRPPSANDIIVGDGGNTTVYRRPDGSEYALDREGRGGEGRTRVYGPAEFDSRSQAEGGAGGNPLLAIAFFVCLILLPVAVLAGVLWVIALALGKVTGHPNLHRNSEVRVIIVVIACIGGFVGLSVVLSGNHSPSAAREPSSGFSRPSAEGYTSTEVAAMVKQKVTQEGIFDAARESITCPEGIYAAGAVLTCTLDSPRGNGNFDVEVTADGINIKVPNEAK
jgi:hypothetical protein